MCVYLDVPKRCVNACMDLISLVDMNLPPVRLCLRLYVCVGFVWVYVYRFVCVFVYVYLCFCVCVCVCVCV